MVFGAAVVVLMVTSCQRQRKVVAAPLPPPPAIVDVAMTEYRFDYDGEIPRGRVVFRFANKGKVGHAMDLVVLTPDIPPIEEQLRGTVRRAVDGLSSLPTQAPGATGVVAADLGPGRYAILCFLKDGDGPEHALLGMHKEFRVR